MKIIGYVFVALVLSCTGVNAVMAQSRPTIAEMEKERLRKAEEEPAPKISVDDIAAATAARKTNYMLELEAGCAAKKASDCFAIGKWHRGKSEKSEQDSVDEATAFGLACQLNHPEGCFNFAQIMAKGQGARVQRNPKTALGAFQQSCKLGVGDGCYNAAQMLNAFGVPPEQQAKKAEAVRTLYRAGCDLKSSSSCQAIGLAPATPSVATMTTAQRAEAAFQADSGITPELIVKKPGDVKPSYTGYMRWDAKKELALQNATSARIDAAVDDYTRKVTAQGYELHIKSYVHPKFSGHKIPLATNYDYAIFSACNENCTNLKLSLEYSRPDLNIVYLEATDRASAATTRWFTFSPTESTKSTGFIMTDPAYNISVRALCSADPCVAGKEAAAQFVIYRRLRRYDIEAAPLRP